MVCSSTRRAFSCSSSDGALARDLALELADRCVAAIELDHLPGGGLRGLLDLRFELVDADGELGAQPVLVGADLRLGERHRPLERVGRKARDAARYRGRR